jgi:hypothetical protein
VIIRDRTTKLTFDELIQFQEAVTALSDIEQSYSIAAQSYVEFEKMLFEFTLAWSFQVPDTSRLGTSNTGMIDAIDISLQTLLNAHLGYLDKIKRVFENNPLFDQFHPDIANTIDSFRNTLHSKNIEYQICYRLRNMFQHGGVSAIQASFSMKPELGSDEDYPSIKSRLRYSIELVIPKTKILNDQRTKGFVRKTWKALMLI